MRPSGSPRAAWNYGTNTIDLPGNMSTATPANVRPILPLRDFQHIPDHVITLMLISNDVVMTFP